MASRSSETAPRPAASEYAPHRACPSSAAARSWHESAPHRPPTARDPTPPTNPPASDSCRWLPCRSAPAPLLAGRTVPRRPRPAPASARQFLLSPYPTNSLAASWDEKSHPIIIMCEGSFLPSSFGPHQKHTEFESSLRSYPINPSFFEGWDSTFVSRLGFTSCTSYFVAVNSLRAFNQTRIHVPSLKRSSRRIFASSSFDQFASAVRNMVSCPRRHVAIYLQPPRTSIEIDAS